MSGFTIGVIGAGAVGQSVAALLVQKRWCERVLVTARTRESAAGLVTDLEDMREITGSSVRAEHGSLAEMRAAHALVVCPRATFTNTATRDIRMAGLTANAPLIRSLAQELTGYRRQVIVVTNPVDVLTRVFATTVGTAARVYGIGSSTDSARYRLALAAHYRVPVGAVRGFVIGEHGDRAVICASTTTVHGRPARVPLEYVRAQLSVRPRQINAGIGRTRCGPAGAVLGALRKTLGLDDGTEVLSVNHRGVWLGIPLQFTAGRPTVTLPALDPGEQRQFTAAQIKLATAYQQTLQGETAC
ncbi:lactate dehydrogenase (plasmid) [Streptomyces murinus]|uniref:lactate/malate family dehydrogenase n=1 Tax=Streptomyces murinus TaxID=33900 RepID=UPI000A1FFB9F|nr:NAD(P)-binding domain-containing protein [Streptomyces murinus]WDO11352.1 lactate dehydrogenase [Streptomyces murinus]